jgi:molybdate transport system substrate-binding protein
LPAREAQTSHSRAGAKSPLRPAKKNPYNKKTAGKLLQIETAIVFCRERGRQARLTDHWMEWGSSGLHGSHRVNKKDMAVRFGVLTVPLLISLAGVTPAQSAELVVSAAASLNNAFKEIGSELERVRSATKVVFNFAASDVLLRQIIEGAPVDVFASADEEAMDKAAKANAIDPVTRFNFAANRLVVVVPREFRGSLASLEDLRRNDIKRIAIGQPATVPAGRYARLALERAGLWESLREKFIYTQNVRQSLDYVARGETDAGFVYASDVLVAAGKVRVAQEVATPRPIFYPIAVTRRSEQRLVAGDFLRFVRSDTGRKILHKNGFTIPPP